MNVEEFLKVVKKEGAENGIFLWNHPLLCELYIKHKERTQVQEQLEYLIEYFEGDKKATFRALDITDVWGYKLTKGYSCSRNMKKRILEKYEFVKNTQNG